MPPTFFIEATEDAVLFSETERGPWESASRRAFEGLLPRRLQPKLSLPAKMAEALYRRFEVDERIVAAGGDPRATPIAICNRLAGWDYVEPFMARSFETTIEAVNCYVATAWFPAAIQGQLTTLHDNRAEAITLACRDPEMIAAAVDSLYQTDAAGARCGVVLFGAFESVPRKLGDSEIHGARRGAFGMLSLIAPDDCTSAVMDVIACHRRSYDRLCI